MEHEKIFDKLNVDIKEIKGYPFAKSPGKSG